MGGNIVKLRSEDGHQSSEDKFMSQIATPMIAARSVEPMNSPMNTTMNTTRPMGRILVVEDDPAVQKALKRLFESEGYVVEIQANGQAALESFRSAAPAV